MHAPIVEAPALRDQVYRRLREAILTGALAQGERISPARVAAELGISPMPVRDAVRLLEQEGLVESSARRWTRVVRLDPGLVEELVPLVSVLEQFALTSAKTIDPEVLAEMESANDALRRALARGDAAACVLADSRFHDALATLAGNRSLERALRDPATRVRLLRPVVLDLAEGAKSLDDHEDIVRALRAGDRRRAARALRANWERGIDRYRRREGAAGLA